MTTIPGIGARSRTTHYVRLVALGLALVVSLLSACASSVPSTATGSAGNAQQATSALTYVAVGASDSFGVGTYDPDRDNWPTQLAHDLGGSIHLVNLGIPGITVAGARKEELPVAIDAHPDIVTVWLAVNDLAGNVPLDTYSQQLSALLDSLKRNTHARVFVGNLPDLTLLPYFSGANQMTLAQTVQAWNIAIARVVSANGATLIDLYSKWSELALNPGYLASDGLHPSTLGAERLAQFFASVMKPALQGASHS